MAATKEAHDGLAARPHPLGELIDDLRDLASRTEKAMQHRDISEVSRLKTKGDELAAALAKRGREVGSVVGRLTREEDGAIQEVYTAWLAVSGRATRALGLAKVAGYMVPDVV